MFAITSIVGTGSFSVDVGCNGQAKNAQITYHDNATWNISGFVNGGSWTQDNCSVNMTDVSLTPNVIWTANTDSEGNISGTFSNSQGLSGCWSVTPSVSEASDGIASAGPIGSAMDFYSK